MGSRAAREWLRLTIAVDADLVRQARRLSLQHNVAVSRLFEEALRGYLATRETPALEDLLAHLPGHAGRPSHFDHLAQARRLAAMRRRQGRRLKLLPGEERPC
ncbi:MAG: hypothetical protein KGK34_02195 [Chloroflexota bacterium]|nr:hypothetical protein [Chloroflexota bacterium]